MTDRPDTDELATDHVLTEQPSAEQPDATESAGAHQAPAPTATAVLTHVVRSIVDDADAVKVDAVEGRNRLKLEVKVGPGDLGRVIGRRGRTAQSIRTVVRAAATRDGVEVDVDFVD
ncbi:MAG: KH domain-containing protein [Ilumatobacteraceae bacterium]